MILHFIERARQCLDDGVALEDIAAMSILRRLQRASEDIPEERVDRFRAIMRSLDDEFDLLQKRAAHAH